MFYAVFKNFELVQLATASYYLWFIAMIVGFRYCYVIARTMQYI